MFQKISLAIACFISSTQAAEGAALATTVVRDIQMAEDKGSSVMADAMKAEGKAYERIRSNKPFDVPSSINIPAKFTSPEAQRAMNDLGQKLERYANTQERKTGRALEPSLKALDQASQSARVRTAGAIAQILRPATSAFALFVDKMGPGKACNVPQFYDCWMAKPVWERPEFLLDPRFECAVKSGCNVRDDKEAIQTVMGKANKVGNILQQLDQKIQEEFQAASEAFAKVVEAESETWCKGVLGIISNDFKCKPGCIEQKLERMGPNANPGMLADQCGCRAPFATTQTVAQLVGMSRRDFYLTSAEDYVDMAQEPLPEVLEEDLGEELVEFEDTAAAPADGAAAPAATTTAPAAATTAPAAATTADPAAAPADGAAATDAAAKSTSQKIKDAYAAAKDKAKSNPTVTIVIIVVVVLLLVGVGLFFYFRSSGKEEGEEGGDIEIADLYRRLM